jgi:carboxy-terminal domain RNA polymerase II polypeptide A small phosphatase
MNIIDPKSLCSYRLFREHCTFVNNAFVKDLTRLGRQMNDVIIVDNSPIAYMFQPENALPILSWYDNPSDRELFRFVAVLERLAYEDDVRKVLRMLIANNELDEK